jgi:hypothetical protein
VIADRFAGSARELLTLVVDHSAAELVLGLAANPQLREAAGTGCYTHEHHIGRFTQRVTAYTY